MKFTKTLAAITAAALAVTSMAVIPASAVEQELGTSGTCIAVEGEWGPDATCIQINGKAVDETSAFDFAATDVITVTAAAANGEDTSAWNLALNSFTNEWTGWAGPSSEAGVLELTVTVQDIMDVLGITDVANFGGFIFQVWNCQVGDEIDWTLKIAPASAATPDDDTSSDDTTTGDDTVGDTENAPGDTETPGESTEAPEKEPAPATSVEITNGGKTVIDSGLVRTNIINAWTGDDATVIAAKEAFAGANLVSVKFTVTGVTEAFDAWISLADSTWAVQYWGADDEGNLLVTQTPITIEKDGTYVLTAELGQVIDAMEFIAICTNLEAAEGDAIPTITIDEIMINEEIEAPEVGDTTVPGESTDPDTNPDTGVVLVVAPAVLAAAALATSGIVLKKRSK